MLKALWACKNESDYSTSFKAVVDRYGTQFRSSTQHDAQEFLFWLLDKVHEDLNTASKRKYKPVKVSIERICTLLSYLIKVFITITMKKETTTIVNAGFGCCYF